MRLKTYRQWSSLVELLVPRRAASLAPGTSFERHLPDYFIRSSTSPESVVPFVALADVAAG